jgi:hypothetical protein
VVDRDVDAGKLIVRPNIFLSGKVRLPAHMPAVSSLLQLWFIPLDGRDLSLMRFRSAQVAMDGTFRFASVDKLATVSEGRYQLEIRGLPTDYYISSILSGNTDMRDSGFVVDGDSPGALDVIVSGPGGGLEGEVRNEKNEPVGDATVVIIPAANRRGNSALFKTAATDQTGHFSMRGIPAGNYGVLAWESVDRGAPQNANFLQELEHLAVSVVVRDSSWGSVSLRAIRSRR